LDKELSQPDHLRVVFERLGERSWYHQHFVVTDPTSSEEGTSNVDKKQKGRKGAAEGSSVVSEELLYPWPW
jgi:hypothetical protein